LNRSTQEDAKIIAVDIQAQAPIPGVLQIKGDITNVCYMNFISFQKIMRKSLVFVS